MQLWKKSVPAHRADAWAARLASAVDPARLVLVTPAGGRSVRVEVYCDTEREARALAGRFGGQVRAVAPESWQPPPATAPGRPLAIGGRLWVTGREEELDALRAAHPGKPVLCIPAAMAFGTGEHATTAMCLRLLAEVARGRRGESWELLDLGTGSGILALAGKLFGASGALGLDNDPHAVRTANENAALNGVRGVRFQRTDLLKNWTPATSATWPVITANLFSELLIALLPNIWRSLADGGSLIASGIMATQAAEVENALHAHALRILDKTRRGKWVAFLVRSSAKPNFIDRKTVNIAN